MLSVHSQSVAGEIKQFRGERENTAVAIESTSAAVAAAYKAHNAITQYTSATITFSVLLQHYLLLLLFSTHLHRFTPQLPGLHTTALGNSTAAVVQVLNLVCIGWLACSFLSSSRKAGRQTGSQLRCAVLLENKNTIKVRCCCCCRLPDCCLLYLLSLSLSHSVRRRLDTVIAKEGDVSSVS